MKFATFVHNGQERFGLVLPHPATGDLWIFDPGLVEQRLQLYASKITSPLVNSMPRFLSKRPWPHQLADFLALEENGMAAARRLQDYLHRFLEQSDQALLAGAGFPLDDVHLRAPIPRPRLFYGLVQNSPTFSRNNPNRHLMNIYPQGHQRPQGSLVGPSEPVVVTPEMDGFSWTPEPGIIIGRAGKNISMSDAHKHISGYTIVMDLVHDRYTDQLKAATGGKLDWFEDATGSWLGKKSDTLAAMGPFLTTPDEVGNPYDLLLYTRQSGLMRDRAHTGSMLIGYERLISWLSSFMTLHPGDVIHMGTLAYDGMLITPDMPFTENDFIEGEMEKVGTLRLPIVMAGKDDWRSEEDPGRSIHAVPAVRDLISRGETAVTPTTWSLDQTRHFWTVFANYKAVSETEGLAIPTTLPRVLNNPVTALTISGSKVHLPTRATAVSVGIELAFVISQVAYRVTQEEANDYILGYTPLLVLHDASFAESIRQPATSQEENLLTVYARWADGFNMLSPTITPLPPQAVRGREMHLTIPDVGKIHTLTDEYVLLAPQILAFLTQEITLFPGDVITLGRIRDLLVLSDNVQTFTASATIEGISKVQGEFTRRIN